MSFWKHNQSSSPQIEAILAKEDLTLIELFDQDCLFQELKSSNKALIDFVTRNDILTELVRLVTEEPSSNLNEKERYKFANLACEVLTTDTPTINEKLSDELYLTKLYSFLESDPPLNPLLASFFSRTLSMLFCRKNGQHWYTYQYTCLHVLDFLKSQSKSLDLLVKHLGTSAIMELTLKLLTQVEGSDLQDTLINLLENECLIDNLMALFDPSVDEDRHYNVSALLCETIYKAKDDLNNSGENGEKRRDTSAILDKIQSVSMVEKLLINCFGEQVSESSIIGGISVLLALLCPPPRSESYFSSITRRGNSDELASGSGDSIQAVYSQTNLIPILSTILPYLPRLHNLLINPPKKEAIKLACGTVDPPLGQARLSIVKLLATLISTNNYEINAKLDELNTVQILLDLFFQYTWNNFLHAQVEKCLALALNSSNIECAQSNPLLPNIFVKCQIIQRILSAWEENEIEQSKGNRRRGYMGHLINIANNLDRQSQEEIVGRFIRENVDPETVDSWQNFVVTVLVPINDIHSRCLGGQHPAQISHEEEVNMKETFDMQEPLLKLQASDDSVYSSSDNNIAIHHYDSCNVQQTDIATIIENILPNLQLQNDWNFKEDLINNICTNWEDMMDASQSNLPCNSSDEELDDDEDNAVWTTCSTGGPLLDGVNPWGGLDTGPVDSSEHEDWATFDSNFAQGFPSDPVQYSEAQPPPLPLSQMPALKDLECGLSSLVADDEDCNPPTEFEFEDSVEPEEDAFEPAVNSMEPMVGLFDPSKVTLEPSKDSVEFFKDPKTMETVISKGSNQLNQISSDQPITVDGLPIDKLSIKESTDFSDSNANLSQPLNDTQIETSSTRLPDKAGLIESALVKQMISDVEKEKENKVPENSDKPIARDDIKSEDKIVEDPI